MTPGDAEADEGVARSRGWQVAGGVACLLFLTLAVLSLTLPDPLFESLLTLVYVGASAMALRIARGRPVYRWICVIMVVFPAELALMTLFFEDAELRAGATSPAEVLTRRAALASLGMMAVASWAAAVAFARPHHDASTPLL